MADMRSGRIFFWAAIFAVVVFFSPVLSAQTSSSSSSSSASPNPTSSKPSKKSAASAGLDPGAVTNSVYRNKTLGFTCKIPPGWVLRTDELNAQAELKQEQQKPADQNSDAATGSADAAKDGPPPASSTGAKVLLAVFSRPPAAAGEEVNSSILIVAESAAAYPGLKDVVQYFEPLTEVAAAQGFTVDEDPYEVAIGTKTLVRGDFHKNVASRVMRQSTLAMLSHGYAVSITVIAGTEDDVEELIDGLDFAAPAGTKK
jgi:hypothetical protein